MIFCEDCRMKNHWPLSAGYPYTGTIQSADCEVCGKTKSCHNVPASRLTPNSEKTTEQKLVSKIMEEGYREKAEALVVTHLSGSESGKFNHRMTDLLRKTFVKNHGTIDWQATYQLRLVIQQGYQKEEESKKNRRTYDF